MKARALFFGVVLSIAAASPASAYSCSDEAIAFTLPLPNEPAPINARPVVRLPLRGAETECYFVACGEDVERIVVVEAPRPRRIAVAVEVRTAQAAALATAMSGGRAGARAAAQIKAPMPGRVVRILVSQGQPVERGQPVAIVEAMKMENELHASAVGTVKVVHVQQGATVDAGQLLIELELAAT